MTQQEYENKIKELQDELEQLKAAKIEAEQPKRWRPEYDETYWMVESNGYVCHLYWNNDCSGDWHYLTGNCFKTVEEAVEHKKQIEYTARYKNYIEEHSEPIDWVNECKIKYCASYDYSINKIVTDDCSFCRTQGTVFASNQQVILDAIKEIGEDNFKKYVLGVK